LPLHAEDPDAVSDWSDSKTTLAQVSYVFGYVLSFVYLALFFVLFIFRNAAQRLIIKPQAQKAKTRRDTIEEEPSGVEAKVCCSMLCA
jgi:hypothetical protein